MQWQSCHSPLPHLDFYPINWEFISLLSSSLLTALCTVPQKGIPCQKGRRQPFHCNPGPLVPSYLVDRALLLNYLPYTHMLQLQKNQQQYRFLEMTVHCLFDCINNYLARPKNGRALTVEPNDIYIIVLAGGQMVLKVLTQLPGGKYQITIIRKFKQFFLYISDVL